MKRLTLNLPVASGALIIVTALLIFGAFWAKTADRIFQNVQDWVLNTFGWWYVLSVAIYFGFAMYFAFSRFGRIRLGAADSEPEYSYMAWSSMLFAAGMGIGLMFYGVAEPMSHYTNPPTAEPRSVDAQKEAMASVFFHWGVHGWAIFGVVGLSLAYFHYRYNLPLTIRSGLYPLLKDRINGPIGHLVDIFAVTGTMFGIATSLGLGVLQLNSGLTYLFGVPESRLVQVIVIVVVIAAASISVLAGLDKGVRRLSELNLSVAILLAIFVLVLGPTLFLLQSLLQNFSLYVGEVIPRTLQTFAYEPTTWFKDWTLFYWG